MYSAIVMRCLGAWPNLPLLEQALTAMESMAMIQWRSPLIARLVEAYLLADRQDDALALMERGLSLALNHGHRGAQAWARRLLGDAVSRRAPDVATARAHYDAGLALAAELGMRPLVAHCHLGLGRLSRRDGNHRKAREHFTTASTMYREMAMKSWPEAAEAELGKLV